MANKTRSKDGLIKISELARRSGVSVPTIKHYIREELLPEPALRTSRNMAWYDPSLVTRVGAIKELQRTRFLPLKVIKEILDGVEQVERGPDRMVASVAEAIRRLESGPPVSREDLLDGEIDARDLEWLRRIGLINPVDIEAQEFFQGEDLALIRTLIKARREGLTPEMLPPSILASYVEAIRHLVRLEIQMFRMGVIPRAGQNADVLTGAAVEISERLVVLLRRKLLVSTLETILQEEVEAGIAPHLPASLG